MERASDALVRTRYFQAEALAAAALRRAHAARDYEAMARVLLPLQEARRQKRLFAIDAAESGAVWAVDSPAAARQPVRAGCALVMPPLLGIDARRMRERADASEVPLIALAREPLTRAGEWPIVAVGTERNIRLRVAPPVPVRRDDARPSKDVLGALPAASWFLSAIEALGDAAIAGLSASDPAAWRVDDLVEFLDALPEHEKLHQRLADECRRALHEPEPHTPRRRGLLDDPRSF